MKAIPVECAVVSHRQLTPTVFEIRFETNAPFTFVGGQFISIIIPGAGPGGRDLRRAYSIASGPATRPIELCVKLVENGPGTNYLNGLRDGSVFKGMVPYGDFVYQQRETEGVADRMHDRHVCFISTGTGIAPFRSMLYSDEFRDNPPASALLLLGVRGEEELLYDEEMRGVSNLTWATCVSRPQDPNYAGFRGRVTDYLRQLPATTPFTTTDYYLCGGSAMIDEVKLILAERGVEKTAIHQEVYYKEPKPV